jgi:hypothetical protein
VRQEGVEFGLEAREREAAVSAACRPEHQQRDSGSACDQADQE